MAEHELPRSFHLNGARLFTWKIMRGGPESKEKPAVEEFPAGEMTGMHASAEAGSQLLSQRMSDIGQTAQEGSPHLPHAPTNRIRYPLYSITSTGSSCAFRLMLKVRTFGLTSFSKSAYDIRISSR